MKFIQESEINLDKYFGLIYMTIFPDDKIYVGYTRKKPGTMRFNNYFGSGKSFAFKNAKRRQRLKLRKIILHVIYKDDDIDNLFIKIGKLETFYKLKTKCLFPEIGYNINKFPDMRDFVLDEKSKQKRIRNIKKSHSRKIFKKKLSNKMKKIWNDKEERNRRIANLNISNLIPGQNKGKVVINNGSKEKFINKNESIPNGWKYGPSPLKIQKLSGEGFSGKNHFLYGKRGKDCHSSFRHWITNGVDRDFVLKTLKIPDGWWWVGGKQNIVN